MRNTLKFRSFQKEDASALSAIINRTWELERFSSPKTATLASELYLSLCLNAQTYTCVAEKDGMPLGLIVVQDKRHFHLRLRQKTSLFFKGIALLGQKDFRALLKMQQSTLSADKKLYQNTGRSYDAELVFFVLSENSRGLGIGKALFQRALGYMQRRHIRNFYLYTDSLCNFGFYDAQKMRLHGHIEKPMFPYRKHPVSFFLYDMDL